MCIQNVSTSLFLPLRFVTSVHVHVCLWLCVSCLSGVPFLLKLVYYTNISSLTEQQIQTLPIKSPKLDNLKQALRSFQSQLVSTHMHSHTAS